ncbi:MAG: NYN domain-containing protein [Gammaproteobacteria bacterium]|nr:NYN domain-containing protein [Gammaproteobacteria bacterium]
MNKIAIFADVQNIYYTTKEAYGRQFNYRKLWQKISDDGEIVSASAYAIDRNDPAQQKFQIALQHIGFNVKLKPYIQRSDGSAKGDWDVGITIDIMDTMNEVDVIILLSGDGDFDLLMQKAQSKGIRAEAYGVPTLSSHSLVQSVSRFHPIEDDLLL